MHQLGSILVCSIDSEQGMMSRDVTVMSYYLTVAKDDSVTFNQIFNILVRLVESGCLDDVLCKQMQCDILQQLCNLTSLTANGGWRSLLGALLRLSETDQLT